MTTRVALLGAGGKMGCRITDNMKGRPEYEMAYVEVSEEGKRRLAERGATVTPHADALAAVDVVVLAIPDRIIGKVTREVIPQLPAGCLVVALDPAAAHAGAMPARDDIGFFVTHPCHPPLFNDDTDPDKRNDWFGGVHASQHVVCALFQGSEEHYARGEKLAVDMYGNAKAPVLGAHRVTVEQMAMLEPALVETFTATLIQSIKEMRDLVVERGVPEAAVDAFLMGHLRTILAIVFGYAGFPWSDGAQLAIDKARSRIFQPDWKEKVMAPENIKKSVAEIAGDLES